MTERLAMDTVSILTRIWKDTSLPTNTNGLKRIINVPDMSAYRKAAGRTK